MLEFNSPRGSDLSVQLSEDSHGAGEVPGDPPLSLHGGSEGIQLLQGHSLPHSLWILRSYYTYSTCDIYSKLLFLPGAP